MYEIIANSVTSGLAIRLGEIFPGVTRYRETINPQLLAYPHFFIHQLSLNAQEERRNHWLLYYLATIRYHIAAIPAQAQSSLEERLDDVSLKLMSELNSISWGGVPVRISQPRTEKIDGTLHYFCNIEVLATKPVEPGPVQEQLDVNISAAG